MQIKNISKALFCGLLLACAAQVSAQTAHLTMHSQAGDYVGQGLDYDITYAPGHPGSFSASVLQTLPSGQPSVVDFFIAVGSDWVDLQFGTNRLGMPMQPGYYADAQRAPFAELGHPGLQISMNGRGLNVLTGNFTVTNFSYSPTLGIQSFAASFEQRGDSMSPALFGTLTYQAVASPVPEPESFALLLAGLGLVGAAVRRRKKASQI